MQVLDRDRLTEWLISHRRRLIAVRHDIHAHPELGFDTTRTVAALERQLLADGLRPVRFTGGLYVDVGRGRPTVGLRADIDGLPLAEQTGLDYASVIEGRSHACGHDVHAAVALGAALAIGDQPVVPGAVRVIFQPAEEILGGARAVLDDGIADGLHRMFALHCEPHMEVGTVGTRSGPMTAACDHLEVWLSSTGGHTARPHLTTDIVDALARLVTTLPGLASRQVDPRAGLSIVFGAIHAGNAANAIPSEGYLAGTVRVLSMTAWRDAEQLITELIDSVARLTGARLRLDYAKGVPPVINDPDSYTLLRSAIHDAVGEANFFLPAQSMGAEDFAWYAEGSSIALGRLGVRSPGGPVTDLHQGVFRADDGAIAVGVRTLVHAAYAALAEQAERERIAG